MAPWRLARKIEIELAHTDLSVHAFSNTNRPEEDSGKIAIDRETGLITKPFGLIVVHHDYPMRRFHARGIPISEESRYHAYKVTGDFLVSKFSKDPRFDVLVVDDQMETPPHIGRSFSEITRRVSSPDGKNFSTSDFNSVKNFLAGKRKVIVIGTEWDFCIRNMIQVVKNHSPLIHVLAHEEASYTPRRGKQAILGVPVKLNLLDRVANVIDGIGTVKNGIIRPFRNRDEKE